MSGSIFKYIAIGCFLYVLWNIAQVVLVVSGPFAPLLIFGLPIVYLVIYLLVKMVIAILRIIIVILRWLCRCFVKV